MMRTLMAMQSAMSMASSHRAGLRQIAPVTQKTDQGGGERRLGIKHSYVIIRSCCLRVVGEYPHEISE
jgi:hypothetical protein